MTHRIAQWTVGNVVEVIAANTDLALENHIVEFDIHDHRHHVDRIGKGIGTHTHLVEQAGLVRRSMPSIR